MGSVQVLEAYFDQIPREETDFYREVTGLFIDIAIDHFCCSLASHIYLYSITNAIKDESTIPRKIWTIPVQ